MKKERSDNMLSIIIPCYNEGKNLKQNIEKIKIYMNWVPGTRCIKPGHRAKKLLFG